MGFPGGASSVKNPPDNAGSIPGSGRCPGRGHGNPLQYSCLENPHGQRSLEGHRVAELDMTEATEHSTAFITHVLCNRHCFKHWIS